MLEKLPEAVGHALRNRRAGLGQVLCNRLDFRRGTGLIELSSREFIDHGPLPSRYTADGAGVSPPLEWKLNGVSAGSLLVVVEDADAPTPHPLVHAIVIDLLAKDGELPEGALPSADHPGSGLRLGRNSLLRQTWLPPDPPPGHGPHRYVFQVFALGDGPPLEDAPGRDDVFEALSEHGLASGWLIGTYERGPHAVAPVEETAVEPLISAGAAEPATE